VQPSVAALGQAVVVTTNVITMGHPSGCLGVPRFAYSGLPAGCRAVGSSVLFSVPAAIGNYTVTVHVHLLNGFGSAGGALQVIP
jgi:hypothetical protein